MKKNHLFIARTNANKGKIARAKRMLILSLACFFMLSGMFAVSFSGTSSQTKIKGAAVYALIIAFPAGVQGNKALHGEDESAADFAARAGKAEDPEKFHARYMRHLEAEITLAKDNPELKAALKECQDAIKLLKPDATLLQNLKSEVEKCNLKIEAISEKGRKEQVRDITGQLKEWAEKNKSALESIKGGKKAELSEMVVKLNSPMTPANTYNGSSFLPIPEFMAGATEIVRVQPTFWDYISKGRTGSATVVWVNKKNPLGAAGFIGPGVAKPGVSFELATESSNAKKIAVSDKVATELLDDIEGMASYIQMEMTYQLRAELNSKLMTGVSSSTVPAGIQTISTTFTMTTVQTQNPGNWDAIVACVAQLRSGNLMGPVTVFMNPVDYANMKLHKAAGQGQLFIPQDSGATIVEDNNIPVGYIQAAILPYYKVLIYKDFTITLGWEDQDFTKNLVTMIAEMRIHQFFSENHTGFAIYDSLANIKAAIEEV